jgi:hypothetical protein
LYNPNPQRTDACNVQQVSFQNDDNPGLEKERAQYKAAAAEPVPAPKAAISVPPVDIVPKAAISAPTVSTGIMQEIESLQIQFVTMQCTVQGHLPQLLQIQQQLPQLMQKLNDLQRRISVSNTVNNIAKAASRTCKELRSMLPQYQGKQPTVGYIMTVKRSEGATYYGPTGKSAEVHTTLVDSGSAICTVDRETVILLEIVIHYKRSIVIAYNGEQCVLTEVCYDVTVVLFEGTDHQLVVVFPELCG